jgi:hypothetical protein
VATLMTIDEPAESIFFAERAVFRYAEADLE